MGWCPRWSHGELTPGLASAPHSPLKAHEGSSEAHSEEEGLWEHDELAPELGLPAC